MRTVRCAFVARYETPTQFARRAAWVLGYAGLFAALGCSAAGETPGRTGGKSGAGGSTSTGTGSGGAGAGSGAGSGTGGSGSGTGVGGSGTGGSATGGSGGSGSGSGGSGSGGSSGGTTTGGTTTGGSGAGGAAGSSGSGGAQVDGGVTVDVRSDTSSGVPDVSSDGPVWTGITLDECGANNPAGLDPATVQKIQTGGSTAGMRWLYPYDGTVFPRGLLAPLVMWEGATATAVYLHIASSQWEYKGCLKPTATGQLQLSQAVWDAVGANSGGPNDPFSVELTILSNGAAFGPIKQKVVVALASIKGSIYYNSYSSKLGPLGTGAILRIPPGKPAEMFLGQSACIACHSLSANGTRGAANDNGAKTGITYAVSATVNPPRLASMLGAEWGGLYPDGSLVVSSAHQGGVGPRVPGGSNTTTTATVYQTDTGTVVANTGIPTGAMMPTFAPDGTMIVFSDQAIQTGRGLAIMDFAIATKTATNYRQLFTNTTNYAGWPFFSPDKKAVIFAQGDQADYTGKGAQIKSTGGVGGGTGGAKSDAYIIDVASGTTTILAQAMGFSTPQNAASNTTYLPFGAADIHQNFYPTVAPVSAGGYHWMLFDSVRNYGNLGVSRYIWGAAIDVSPSGTYTTDPSHPAFFVTGQEMGTANHRAFAALDGCHTDGNSCEVGVECCGQVCTNGICTTPTVR